MVQEFNDKSYDTDLKFYLNPFKILFNSWSNPINISKYISISLNLIIVITSSFNSCKTWSRSSTSQTNRTNKSRLPGNTTSKKTSWTTCCATRTESQSIGSETNRSAENQQWINTESERYSGKSFGFLSITWRGCLVNFFFIIS